MTDSNDKKQFPKGSPFYNMTQEEIYKLLKGEHKKLYDSVVDKNKTLSNCRSVMIPLVNGNIMERLEAAAFYMRRAYRNLHEGHTPIFLISLSARGYVDLMEDERKNGTQKFSRWDVPSKTLIGYPYVIRKGQTELFKIIER